MLRGFKCLPSKYIASWFYSCSRFSNVFPSFSGNIGWPANLISFASSHRVTDSRCIAQYTYHGPCLYCTIWLTLAMQIPDFQQLHLQLVHFPNVPTTQPTGEAWPWWRWHWCGRGDPWRHLRQRRSGGKKSLGKIVIGKVGDWHPCN